MKTKILMLFLLSILFFTSCENGTELEPYNSNKFTSGIINMDREVISEEFDKLVADLTPEVTADDKWGHYNNFSTLINRINSQYESIEAQLRCYACIETAPPQSEIEITTDSSGVQIRRVIDILTPSDKRLSFRNAHK